MKDLKRIAMEVDALSYDQRALTLAAALGMLYGLTVLDTRSDTDGNVDFLTGGVKNETDSGAEYGTETEQAGEREA